MLKSNSIHSKRITTASLIVALGIIYGDIGTSPLYVLRAIIGEKNIDEVLVLGGVSCIFWTLVFQTTIKYVWLTLKADNEGEGGILSLYALVRKYGKKLVIPAILGATTLLADGIITPPITITSAVEGLDKVFPHLPTIPIVIIILSGLFIFQRFGTQKVGKIFGPVMAVWFTMLLILGFSQIIKYPGVIKGLNPYYAYLLLTKYPGGFWLLGSVFLATTGAEALYSDLGHCGRKNIRVSWAFVKICLLTNYIGQAAWLMHQGQQTLQGKNPFFEIIPEWFLLPGIIIATFASIIASQALISGSYTLISEAINLNFWPRVTVRQPTELKGQIYIPSVNMLLWMGCVSAVLYFKSSVNMEAAYGFFITITMMMTTILLSFFLIYRLKWNKLLVFGIVFIFGLIEFSFFIANLIKIEKNWAFLLFGIIIFMVMYIWYYSRKILNSFTKFVQIGKYTQQIIELNEDISIPKFSTHLIYLTKANNRNEIEEKIINSIFDRKPKRADVYWFFHINRTEQPYTLSYDVSELIDDKLIKINLNVGFRVQPRTELFFKKIMQELIDNKELNLHIRSDGSTKYNATPDFKFVVFEKFLSVENEFTLHDGLLLNSYFFIKYLAQTDQKAFGLDRSDVTLEQVPLIYHPVAKIELKRNSIKKK